MKLHPTREATPADIDQIAAACTQAQAEHWEGIRRPIEWTEELKAHVLEKLYLCVAVDGAVVRGVLILEIKPAALVNVAGPWNVVIANGVVEVKGWTTPQIPHKDCLGMGLSMLIGSYQPLVDAGVTWGYGDIMASNKIILDTLSLVHTFEVRPSGKEPISATVSESDRKPHIYHAESKIGPAYLAALEAALKGL